MHARTHTHTPTHTHTLDPHTHIPLTHQEEHQKGNNLYRNRNFEKALRVYTRALHIDPDNDCYCAIVYANRAAAALALKQYKQVRVRLG